MVRRIYSDILYTDLMIPLHIIGLGLLCEPERYDLLRENSSELLIGGIYGNMSESSLTQDTDNDMEEIGISADIDFFGEYINSLFIQFDAEIRDGLIDSFDLFESSIRDIDPVILMDDDIADSIDRLELRVESLIDTSKQYTIMIALVYLSEAYREYLLIVGIENIDQELMEPIEERVESERIIRLHT